MKSPDKEQMLFELAQKIGEGIFDAIHIINGDDDEYRIYHGGGHCWDVRMERAYSDETDFEGNDVEVEPTFDFYEGWDGFSESGIDFAISELKKIAK